MYRIESNSIELWGKQTEDIFAHSQNPLTEEEIKTFIKCYMSEKEIENDEEIKTSLEKKKLGYASVFYNRVRLCHTYQVSLATCLFIGTKAKSFGEITIYTNYFQYKAFKNQVNRVDMDFLSTKIFPLGFPDEIAINNVWDNQKVKVKDSHRSDNLLDYDECQESITIKRND